MPDDLIYHYTSVAGLFGILSSKSIRLAHSDYLNDPYDCSLFSKLVGRYFADTDLDEILSDTHFLDEHKESLRALYELCPLSGYVRYLHQQIPTYVISLTNLHDEMNMWNYYGSGGAELAFDRETLLQAFKKDFTEEENQFLTEHAVFYAQHDEDLGNILVPRFSEFHLRTKTKDDFFGAHKDEMEANQDSGQYATALYKIDNLNKFVELFLKDYLLSLQFLLRHGTLQSNSEEATVHREVLCNTITLRNITPMGKDMRWKYDMTLYCLVLSALIKNSTYRYENERRIVYFQFKQPDDVPALPICYDQRTIKAGSFLYPYITLLNKTAAGESDGQKEFSKALVQLVLSPSTRNLPIDEQTYCENLRQFLTTQGYSAFSAPDSIQKIVYSKHAIRW